MHKSDECVLVNTGNLKRMHVIPTTAAKVPQIINTRWGPNTL